MRKRFHKEVFGNAALSKTYQNMGFLWPVMFSYKDGIVASVLIWKYVFCLILRNDDINLKLSNFFYNSPSKVLLSQFHYLSLFSTIFSTIQTAFETGSVHPRKGCYSKNVNQSQNIIILTNYSGRPMIQVIDRDMRYFAKKKFSRS